MQSPTGLSVRYVERPLMPDPYLFAGDPDP